MLFNIRIGRFFSRNNRRTISRRPRVSTFRPRLEALEDRFLLTAGALDPTFGNGAGYVVTSLSSSADEADSVLVQPNGQILVTGEAWSTGGVKQVGLARYNADGSLDTSFGNGGEVLQPYTYGTPHAALYPIEGTANDGKIVLAGFAGANFSVARLDANGTLDTAFGTNGIATANFGSTLGTWGAASAVVQPDGKIDVVGSSEDDVVRFGITYGRYVELAQFNADGSLDTTFGQRGLVTTYLGGDLVQSMSLTNILLQSNGGLIVTLLGSGHWDLVGYNADGSLNSSFGNGGIVKSPQVSSTGDGLRASALYPTEGNGNDGKIVLVGEGYSPSTPYAEMVRRYNTNGTLDSTFGNDGTLLANDVNAFATVIQPDGQIIVAGTNLPTEYFQTLVRYNTDGSLNTSFGIGGIVNTGGGNGSPYEAYSVALKSNGDIIAAGQAMDASGSKIDFAATRYLGDSSSFSVTGFPSSVTAGKAGSFTVTALNADGSVNTGYLGTVHFTSSDPHAVLPADYTFTAADQGVHTFSATLVTAGSQSIIATDTTTSTTFGGEAGIQVSPAAASQFILSAPSSVSKGSKFDLTLTVEDAFGNVVTGYVGTVHFTSSDSTATLPANYTFTAADAGVHTFSKAFVLKKKGTQTIMATDTQNSALTATDSINVS